MAEGGADWMEFVLLASLFWPLYYVDFVVLQWYQRIGAMAGGSSSSSQPNVLLFKGENYNLWSLKMKTVFRSKDLWSIVEKGIAEEADNNRLNEIMKKDAKALCLIQQNLDDRVLLRITEAKTAKQAWEVLKTQYQGNENNVSVKLHSLHRELDVTKMKHGEKIEDFSTRVLDIVYQIKVLGEEFPEKKVVTKILRSLTPRFTNVVSSIVEAKNLSTLTVDELCGSLRSHESILNNAGDQDEVKTLHVRTTLPGDHLNRGGRGRGRGGFHRGKGRGHGRGRNSEISHSAESSQQNKGMQCFICKKYGHIKS
ncbi:uncharacterized protein LOC120274664 [Dioscorea cayenensis subsp. rotundata]|uniref:Uncharacterized protein LOC120274664 n=1 Tax=Dioscorea cayennensis subsp. rotundata TaxID=55577 RepID=A0AB40CEH3_DIOCR|nr:uncharacterized protein LOC120274664 [Dioscorea cayenensis subsp. rotundata]